MLPVIVLCIIHIPLYQINSQGKKSVYYNNQNMVN